MIIKNDIKFVALEKSEINSLNENDKVSYDEARNNDKISASNIKILTN